MEINHTEYIEYRGHKIAKIVHQKQCKAYYDALKDKKDAYAVHHLYKPPYNVPMYIIQRKMRIIDLIENYKEEMKRIDEMPKEMLKCELEIKYGITLRKKKKKKFLRIF